MNINKTLLAIALGFSFANASQALEATPYYNVKVELDATKNGQIRPQAVIAPVSTTVYADYPEFSQDNHKFYDTVRDTNTAGRFNDVMRFLADQLTQNRDVNSLSTTFAVASIVALDDVSRTNKVGYLLQEHLLHELQVRGYKVVDFKLMKDQLQVTQQGDFVFSRDPKKLNKSLDIANVVSGTYSFQAEGVIINLRAVDTRTGVITSTAQGYIPRGEYEYLMTGKPTVFMNGEYFYRAAPQVRTIEIPTPFDAVHNQVNIK